MANLGDAFKKAGLVSDKEQRQRKHEERLHRKEAGREGLQNEEAGRAAERAAREEEERKRHRALEKERQERRSAAEAAAKARDVLRAKALADVPRGPRRFHYVDSQGFVLFLMVGDDLGRRLEAGELGIAEGGLVVPREAAAQARALDPRAVCFLNG